MVKIDFSDITQCVFKYYLNQTIYFNLVQSSNITEEPYIIQTVKNMIELYYSKKGNRQKLVLERAIDEFPKLVIEDDYDKAILHISNIFKKDVSYRFPKVDGKILTNIYIYI